MRTVVFGACYVTPLGLIGLGSVEGLECLGGASLDVRVAVGRCCNARLCEKVSSLLDVARSMAFQEHRAPREIGAGGERFGAYPVVEGCRLAK